MNAPFSHRLGIFVVTLAIMTQFLAPVFVGVVQAQQNPSTGYVPYNGNPPTDTIGGDDLLFQQPVIPSDPESRRANEQYIENLGSENQFSPNGAQSGTDASDDTGDESQASLQTVLSAMESKSFLTVYNIFIMIGGWVAGFGGMLFDIAVDSLVLKFGCWITTGSGGCEGRMQGQVGGVIDEVWKVIRDLFNIVFIFALVWIGLRLILGADETGTRRAIGFLIAAALLVNFSLYISKLVIDVANFTAVQIHTSMVGGLTGEGFSVTASSDEGDFSFIDTTGKYSIAGAFMQTLRISTFFSANAKVDDGVGAVVVGLLAFVFLCYLGFVLAYGAVMLVVRFIALVILLIFSPMMFLGWVLPSMEKYSSQWRTMFLAYSFFIPAYLLLLYISLYVMIQVAVVLGDNGHYADAIVDYGGDTSTSDWEVYMLYMLGVGFLYASTKVASAMSKSGAVIGMTAGSSVARRIAGAPGRALGYGAKGAGGWAGRTAIGGWGGDTLKDWSERREARTGKSGVISRGLRRAGTNLEGRKYGGSYSLADKRKAVSEGDRRAAGLASKKEARKVLENPHADEAAKQRAIAKLDKSEIIEMSKTADGADLLTKNAQYLTSDHIKALTEDKEKDVGAVASIVRARGAAVQQKLDAGTEFKDLTSDDLAAMDLEKLKEPDQAVHLNDKKIEKLPLVEAEQNDLKQARKDAFISIVHDGTPQGGIDMKKITGWDAEKIADLPTEIFNPQSTSDATKQAQIKKFIRSLPTSSLAKIQSKKGGEVAREMRKVLMGYASSGTGGDQDKQRIYEWLTTDNVGKNFGK